MLDSVVPDLQAAMFRRWWGNRPHAPVSADGHIYKVSPDVEVGSAMRLVLARLDAVERAIEALRAELAGRRAVDVGTVATEMPVHNPFRVFPEDRRRVGG